MSEYNRNLPNIRGSYRFDAPLAKTNWFGVGGNADVLFKPEDAADLTEFLKQVSGSGFQVPGSVLEPGTRNLAPVTVIGVGSNLIIRDGGIRGVVVRLGRGFTDVAVDGDVMVAGAALLDVHLASVAAGKGRAGLEFMSGIPGTVGGALAMNAGAYGREVKDVLIKAEAVTPTGDIIYLTCEEMHYSYRHYNGPKGLIFTRAWFRTTADAPDAIAARIAQIQASREATQPIRERTGGSTFKNPLSSSPQSEEAGRGAESDAALCGSPHPNPPPMGEGIPPKAWQLIDAAGCRGLRVGVAQMSELHCNFMINTGGATAADLEALGEEVRARVLAHSGVTLEWEIKRIGEKM